MDTSYESIKVNLDVNPNDLLDNAPEKIVNLLIGVSQRAEKCFDFQISAWLEKYETVRKQPNFAEAGLLIYSASQIYSRKMNFFEKMVYQLAANSKNKEDYKDIDQTNMVSRRGNKLRNSTIVDSLDEAEFFVREFDHVPNVKFTELIKKKNFEFNSYWEKFKHSQCRFLKNKKNKLFISKKNSIDNSELIVTNAGLEKNHICDYDGEDIVGTKADFRCFSYIFNDKFQLVSDYNFNRYFKQVDLVNEMHKHQQEVQSKIKRKDYIRFKFYISNDYLKNTYDIELTKNINGEMECNHSTDLNITDLVNSKSTTESASYDLNTSAKSSVACDSAYQSVLSTNYTLDRRTTEKNDFFSASIFGENSDKELTECNLHDEHDEGISIRSFSIQSPINMSETGSEINLDMVYNLQSSIQKVDQSLNIFRNTQNLFWIDPVYLEHKENFEIPINFLVQKVNLDINFLRLPDRKLKRKCIFALPPDDFKLRCIYIKLPVESSKSRVNKGQHSQLRTTNDSIHSSSNVSDTEDFYGFEELNSLLEFNQNIMETNTSTPNKKVSYDASQTIKEIPSINDSQSLITDDEDIEKSKNDNNLSTPERIRRINSARVSRDSGVVSPEPNSLTITMSENENKSDFCFDLQHNNSDNTSVIRNKHQYQEQISYIQTLIEKVNRWHQYLKPILKASEDRSSFDIHEYGTEVLHTFTGDREEITFANVMINKPDDQFARYFLATLMLVNTGNLLLTNKNMDVDRVSESNEIHLQLKSHERFYEKTQNTHVPCIIQTSGTTNKKRKFEVDNTSIELKKCKKDI